MSVEQIASKSKLSNTSLRSKPVSRTTSSSLSGNKMKQKRSMGVQTIRFDYSTEVLKAIARLEKQLSELPAQAGQLPGVLDYTTDILIYRLLEIYDDIAHARNIEATSPSNGLDSARKSSMFRDSYSHRESQGMRNSTEEHVARRRWQTGLNLLKSRDFRESRDSFDRKDSLPRYSDPISKEGIVLALDKPNKVNKHVRRQRLANPPIPEKGQPPPID